VDSYKKALGLNPDSIVGLFCGNLAEEKKIYFLFQAAIQVREECSSFHLLVLGRGPFSSYVTEMAKKFQWVTYLGRLNGEEKAQAFFSSDFLVSPGMVGLNIIDGFTAGLPMVTTDTSNHSPEIAYLEPGRNGLVTKENIRDFAQGILNLIKDPKRLNIMKKAAQQDSEAYSLEKMVENFGGGIQKALV